MGKEKRKQRGGSPHRVAFMPEKERRIREKEKGKRGAKQSFLLMSREKKGDEEMNCRANQLQKQALWEKRGGDNPRGPNKPTQTKKSKGRGGTTARGFKQGH